MEVQRNVEKVWVSVKHFEKLLKDTMNDSSGKRFKLFIEDVCVRCFSAPWLKHVCEEYAQNTVCCKH